MHQKYLLVLLLPLLFLLSSCDEKTYRIGVSQCGMDAWHLQMNTDLEREANSHPEVELIVRLADEGTPEQIAQLEELLSMNIDLLIVSPNDGVAMVPIIEKFYDSGIPVVLVDRTLNSNKYTASISSDNFDIGERIASYITSRLGGKGRILEIQGNMKASTAQDRHRGLLEGFRNFPDIHVVGGASGKWTAEEAQVVTDSLLRLYPDIDLIFSHSDLMAEGVYEACKSLGIDPIPPIVGVDGLPGPGLGIDNIMNGRLAATCINISGGHEAFSVALDILEDHPFPRKTVLSPVFVDEHNVSAINMQRHVLDIYNKRIEEMNGALGTYWRRTKLMKALLVACILIIGLITTLIISIFRSRKIQERLLLKNLLLNLKQIEQKPEDPAQVMEMESPDESTPVDAEFVTRLHDYIKENMNNPDLNINDLCQYMRMSRVQLYRKSKLNTNFSPVEFVRIIRLKQGKHLLETTQLSVSEIAYEVGFSSPSYFAKCYRDQYGISPTELRNTL